MCADLVWRVAIVILLSFKSLRHGASQNFMNCGRLLDTSVRHSRDVSIEILRLKCKNHLERDSTATSSSSTCSSSVICERCLWRRVKLMEHTSCCHRCSCRFCMQQNPHFCRPFSRCQDYEIRWPVFGSSSVGPRCRLLRLDTIVVVYRARGHAPLPCYSFVCTAACDYKQVHTGTMLMTSHNITSRTPLHSETRQGPTSAKKLSSFRLCRPRHSICHVMEEIVLRNHNSSSHVVIKIVLDRFRVSVYLTLPYYSVRWRGCYRRTPSWESYATTPHLVASLLLKRYLINWHLTTVLAEKWIETTLHVHRHPTPSRQCLCTDVSVLTCITTHRWGSSSTLTSWSHVLKCKKRNEPWHREHDPTRTLIAPVQWTNCFPRAQSERLLVHTLFDKWRFLAFLALRVQMPSYVWEKNKSLHLRTRSLTLVKILFPLCVETLLSNWSFVISSIFSVYDTWTRQDRREDDTVMRMTETKITHHQLMIRAHWKSKAHWKRKEQHPDKRDASIGRSCQITQHNTWRSDSRNQNHLTSRLLMCSSM